MDVHLGRQILDVSYHRRQKNQKIPLGRHPNIGIHFDLQPILSCSHLADKNHMGFYLADEKNIWFHLTDSCFEGDVTWPKKKSYDCTWPKKISVFPLGLQHCKKYHCKLTRLTRSTWPIPALLKLCLVPCVCFKVCLCNYVINWCKNKNSKVMLWSKSFDFANRGTLLMLNSKFQVQVSIFPGEFFSDKKIDLEKNYRCPTKFFIKNFTK